MLFNSFEYLLFLPLVTALFFLLPHRYRWTMLLVVSCIFYMYFKPEYILILAFTIIIDYFAGIYIYESKLQSRKKMLLWVSVCANILVLAFFKYYNFGLSIVNSFGDLFNANINIPMLDIVLPIGLSFHTFQAMSYTIEVYRGNQIPEKHLGIYALYVMFFPQMVAGPIERPQNLLHQFREIKRADVDRIISGLKLIFLGLFKKLVIANRLAPMVDQVYNNPTQYHGLSIILATLFFAEQIYCDFSGYSDIAIGSARILGFDLMLNFRNPYLSRSISEFWSRWHISLSTWFKDYLYIPLGGNKVPKSRWMANLFITFLISGIWHGANWTFVLWGALNGAFIILEILIGKQLKVQLPKALAHLLTITLISITWLFFRANSLPDAYVLIQNMMELSSAIPFPIANVILGVTFIAALEFYQFADEKYDLRLKLKLLPYSMRLAIYAACIAVLLNFGIFTNSTFIYFQF